MTAAFWSSACVKALPEAACGLIIHRNIRLESSRALSFVRRDWLLFLSAGERSQKHGFTA